MTHARRPSISFLPNHRAVPKIFGIENEMRKKKKKKPTGFEQLIITEREEMTLQHLEI